MTRFRLLHLIIGLLMGFEAGSASAKLAHRQDEGATCTSPRQRRAWHTFSDGEKKAYIGAELCLMNKPAELGLRGTRTRFDELQSCHILQAEITHFVGAFLPFHRLLMWAHEELLINECGYTGAQPYWQEQLDAGNFLNSVVLDPVTGFGGNGTGPNNCIEDGPFASYNNTLGPGYQINDHCIDRIVSEAQSAKSSQAEVDICLAKETWLEAWSCIEAGPHAGGHGGVGGEMTNPISSPGDPVFYLHHTWLDKLWWDWQLKHLDVRLTEMGGRNKPGNNTPPTFTGPGFPLPSGTGPGVGGPPGGLPEQRPDDVPEPIVVGDPGNETTLGHVINMYGVVPNRTIGEVMDIRGILCYEYVELED